MKKLFTLFLLLNTAVFFGQWTASMVVPTNVCQQGLVAHPNGKVYLFSGWNGTGPEVSSMYIFNTATNTWTTGPSVPYTARGVGYCLGTDNMIYCVGGYPVTNSFARYDVATSTWSTLTSCPNGNWEGSITSYNGKIYYAGGETVESSMRSYDIAAGTWSTLATIPVGLKLHKLVSSNNGYLYMFGGHTSASSPTNTVQRYDVAANTWSVMGTMPVQKNQYGACLAPDGRIYIVCGKNSGSNNSGPFFNDVNIYNPCANTWTAGFAHPTAHGELAVTSTTNGIFAMGGTSGSGLNLNYFLPVTPGSLSFPSITFTPAAISLCGPTTVTLTANGASTYTWSTGSNSPSIVITPTSNTTYTVAGTSSVGCTGPGVANSVTVNPSATVTAVTNNSIICTGNSATLTASGAATYTWNTASNATAIAVSPTTTTTYTVSGTNGSGCSATATVTQNVSLCTGIADNTTAPNAFAVYPNPSTGNLNIDMASLSENVMIEVYNSIGQLMLSKKATDLTTNLTIENTANGIYTIRITENGKNVFNSKIVKQ